MEADNERKKDPDIFIADYQHELQDIWESANKQRCNSVLCDAALVINERRFPVHKAILAANSDYFKDIFINQREGTENSEMRLEEMDPHLIKLILDFVYSRKADLSIENVFSLLSTAEKFMMYGLRDVCCKFMASHLNTRNCVGIMEYGHRYGYPELIKAAKVFIVQNFPQVATESIDFLELDVEILSNILSDDRLNVRKEEEVYEAIIRWVDFAVQDRLQCVPGLLIHVRLGLVQPSYFLDFIGGHNYIKDNEACAEIVKRAWDILYCVERGSKDIRAKFVGPLVQPRIPHEVIFAIGGWSGGAPISVFETYDPRADRWFPQPTLEDSESRAYHAMVLLNKKIYVMGGFDGSQYYSSTRTFDPVVGRWQEVAPMNVLRCYISAATLGGRIYACGGYEGHVRLNVAERYDPENNQWSLLPPMSCKRSDAGCDALNGKIYVVGGFDGERCLNSSDVFDPVTGQWTLLPHRMSVRRSGVSAVACGGYLYVLGGFDGDRRLASVERFCPETARWQMVSHMYNPRSNFAAVPLEGCIYVIGGFNGSHTVSYVECLDLETNEWYDIADMNINRSALKACVISGLENAVTFTFHGQKRHRTQKDVSGDAVCRKQTRSKRNGRTKVTAV